MIISLVIIIWGGDYISDPKRSNRFGFKDITIAAYSSFEHEWTDELSTVLGLRLETYHADGTQKTTGQKVPRHETNFTPSLTINYMPSDDHDFSLSIARSVARPVYFELNPFERYTSPTSYTKGNPDLETFFDWELDFSYSFFDDFYFDVMATYTDNLCTMFTIPDADNNIMSTNINFGNSFSLISTFGFAKRLFNGYWRISGNVGCSYNRYKGSAEDIDIDRESTRYYFNVSSDLVFSKKANISLYSRYYYGSARKSIATFSPAMQTIDCSLSKRFDHSSLSIGVNRMLSNNYKSFYETPKYGFTDYRKTHWSWHASYSVTFGNNEVRNVEGRANRNISNRL